MIETKRFALSGDIVFPVLMLPHFGRAPSLICNGSEAGKHQAKVKEIELFVPQSIQNAYSDSWRLQAMRLKKFGYIVVEQNEVTDEGKERR
jgi:hypothetical protein